MVLTILGNPHFGFKKLGELFDILNCKLFGDIEQLQLNKQGRCQIVVEHQVGIRADFHHDGRFGFVQQAGKQFSGFMRQLPALGGV